MISYGTVHVVLNSVVTVVYVINIIKCITQGVGLSHYLCLLDDKHH